MDKAIDLREAIQMADTALERVREAGPMKKDSAVEEYVEAAKAAGSKEQARIVRGTALAAYAEKMGFQKMQPTDAVLAMAPGTELIRTSSFVSEWRARSHRVHLWLILPAAILVATIIGAISTYVADPVAGTHALIIVCGGFGTLAGAMPWIIVAGSAGKIFVMTDLDRLKDPVPMGILLKIGELRGTFDRFHIVAPVEMTTVPRAGSDPIVLGQAGTEYFFVARWDPKEPPK